MTGWTQEQIDANNRRHPAAAASRNYAAATPCRASGAAEGQDSGRPIKTPPRAFKAPSSEPESPKTLKLVISGQIRGGKNGMGVRRDGRHFMRPLFRQWRKDAISQIIAQVPANLRSLEWVLKRGPIFEGQVSVELYYFAGDRRRRDQPSIIDALWHVLQGSQIVRDDMQLWVTRSRRAYDKENPRAEITLTTI